MMKKTMRTTGDGDDDDWDDLLRSLARWITFWSENMISKRIARVPSSQGFSGYGS